MDKELIDIYNMVQTCIEKTAYDREQCEKYLKTAAPGDLRNRLDIRYNNLTYRAQRLAAVADILNGRATVVEKGDDLKVIKATPEKVEAETELVCHVCGSAKWWMCGDRKTCGVCHPEPVK